MEKPENQKRTVSVIIPTYRPGRDLQELLRRLVKQTYRAERILIVNTEDAYFPLKQEEMPANVRVLHIDKASFDHGGTRDLAARMCKSDLLVFMTQDAIPADTHLLENLVSCFERDDVAAAYARQLPRKGAGTLERFTRGFSYGPESEVRTRADLDRLGIRTFCISNVCAAYRRGIYMQLGGFEKHTIFNEDMIYGGWLINEGYAITYCAQARVYHSHAYSGLQQFHRNFDLGVSQAQHPDIFGMARSEGEGIRLVKESMLYLVKKGRLWEIPVLIWQSGWKYLGYRLGKAYRRLPAPLVRWCSLNRSYWKET